MLIHCMVAPRRACLRPCQRLDAGRVLLIAALMMLATSPQTAAAQRPLTIGIGGGVTMPVGPLADGASTGWHALATAALGVPMLPMGLRLDAAHNVLDAKAASGESRITSGTLNLTYRLPMVNSPISPFLIVGGGAYHLSCSGGVPCESATKGGWNAGAGLRFAALGLRGIVESRYHRAHVSGPDVQFVPVSLLLTF